MTWMNGCCCFYYSGGESGINMPITQNGTLQIRNYEGTIPHIAEALFKSDAKKE